MTFEIKKTITFFVICLLVLSVLFIRMNKNIKTEPESTTSPSVKEYTVKEYNGKIAVFENDNTKPENVYDSYISVLPEKDRQRLKYGITVDNEKDLQRIIEDYTS